MSRRTVSILIVLICAAILTIAGLIAGNESKKSARWDADSTPAFELADTV